MGLLLLFLTQFTMYFIVSVYIIFLTMAVFLKTDLQIAENLRICSNELV